MKFFKKIIIIKIASWFEFWNGSKKIKVLTKIRGSQSLPALQYISYLKPNNIKNSFISTEKKEKKKKKSKSSSSDDSEAEGSKKRKKEKKKKKDKKSKSEKEYVDNDSRIMIT